MQTRKSPFAQPDQRLRQAEIESAKTLNWCRERLGLASIPIPVPIEAWVEQVMGLRLSVEVVSEIVPDAEGLGNPLTGEITIAPFVAEDDRRFRFVCAHELGHILLHADSPRVFMTGSHAATAIHDVQERQADHFAACLLMPEIELLDAIIEILRMQRLELEPTIERLIAGDRQVEPLWERALIPGLAERMLAPADQVIGRLVRLHFRNSRSFMPPHVANRLRPRFGISDLAYPLRS